ncbi:MAG: hypothetical protein PXX82_00555 [Methanomassiliicoccales archaeon]|nr:hypothetical protein [Methanomassiliicoccales archaeon]
MNYRFSELLRMGGKSEKGPGRKFGPFHYFKALTLIDKAGRTGRAKLASEIGIGEGSIRTLLDDLETNSLIARNNSGNVVTSEGKRVISSLRIAIMGIQNCSLSLSGHSSVAVVKSASKRVTNGIMQRDEAVRNGGVGATTLIVRKKGLYIPPEMKHVNDRELENAVFGEMHASEGDVVIVGSGSTAISSEIAVFSASLTLL